MAIATKLKCLLKEVRIKDQEFNQIKRNLIELLYEYLQRGENKEILIAAKTSGDHPQLDQGGNK